ncbi:RfbB dTDP-D-glucose 4,6-dehydratase [Fimbriimonadaceae bacterium]
MNLLVTGAAGFIGSHFVRLVRRVRPDWTVHVLDALTYSGNCSTMADFLADGLVNFHHGRIEDYQKVSEIVQQNQIDQLVNFAAESHNDRSLVSGSSFLVSNAMGVENLLNVVRENQIQRFVQVSTDEVYGTIAEGKFTEETPIAPNTPYSASKAAGDLQCRAHFKAYKTPVVVTRGGNTFGPFQYPEKLIPFFATRLIQGKHVPLYGDGSQIREWIHAEDHAAGVLHVLEHGLVGEAYNIGDVNERTNLEILEVLLEETGRGQELVINIEDPRKGAHDARYSMATDKLQALGWKPEKDFIPSLRSTIQWYRENRDWWEPIVQDPQYQAFVKQYYGKYLGDLL